MVGGVQLGDVATWVTAVGTLVAVAVALWLAGRDARQREASHRRHQAEQVTAWLGTDETPEDARYTNEMIRGLIVRNASSQAVYQVIASLVSVQGAFRETAVGCDGSPYEYRTFMWLVPPGETHTRIQHGGGGMMLRFAVELAFQDAAGRSWLRHGDGKLEQIDRDPLALYGVPRPVPWDAA